MVATLLMTLYKPDRRANEIELLAEPIFQMTQEREMQTALGARSANHKRRRTHAPLRDVLDMQARAAVTPGGDDAAALDHPLVKLIQLRSRNAPAARFVRADGERQKLQHSLAN